LFQFLAIPMIQADLDRFVRIHNSSCPRSDRRKAMPAEIPNVLLERSDEYGPYYNYKIHISTEQLQTVRALYAPPEHDVFHMVPEPIYPRLENQYHNLGDPEVNRVTFWAIYCEMRDLLSAEATECQTQED
ncbi:hypothetical protein CALCODRAFT_418588, partial [Calocera cornea HHB12733]